MYKILVRCAKTRIYVYNIILYNNGFFFILKAFYLVRCVFFSNFAPAMIEVTKETIGNFQFMAIAYMLWLTHSLVFMLFRRGGIDKVLNRSRWLMAGGTAILTLHFLLQYILKLRYQGDTQPLMLNLLMFIPASWLISLSELNLQRQGRIYLTDWLVGGVMWGLSILLIIIAAIGDGQPFFCDTPQMRTMVKVSAFIYFVGLFYYTIRELTELRRMRRSLKNYYDRDVDYKLRWMYLSILIMAVMSLLVPAAIVASGIILFAFGVIVFLGIGYLVMSFRDYVISKRAYQVMLAQENAREAGVDEEDYKPSDISEEERRRVDVAVKKWLSKERYLKQGLTMPTVVQELNVSQQMLRAWFPTVGYDSYADWMQHLRIEYAKRMMEEHPEYSIETIANQCGFRNRNYFHTIFRQVTGVTPTMYLEKENLSEKEEQ